MCDGGLVVSTMKVNKNAHKKLNDYKDMDEYGGEWSTQWLKYLFAWSLL